ncbi:MAG: gamma carbonic anhydrase family protein [Myxococcales bacterium]|nr:gamma carbonic anhydrase family protein [Myxococcales bacterium]
MIQDYQGRLPIIDPTAYIHPAAVVIGDVQIGAESTVWPNVTLRADDGKIRIGVRTSIQDGSTVHMTEHLSNAEIGDQVTVGHNVIVHGAKIQSNCIIGMGSILLDNAEIGEFCLIGAQTLITQNKVIPPHSLVMGSPGKVIRQVTEKEIIWIAYSWQRYVEQGRRYRASIEPSIPHQKL